MQEILSLVNQNDEVIGFAPRHEIEKTKDTIVRVSSCLIFNNKNQILLGVKHKYLPRKIWTLVGTGHVAHLEDPITGVIREVKEEAGILLKKENLLFLTKKLIDFPVNKSFFYIYKTLVNPKQISYKPNTEFLLKRFFDISDITSGKIKVSETTKKLLGEYP